MAVEKKDAASQTTKSLTERHCPEYAKTHDEHVWKSYVLKEDCYCDGKVMTAAEYHESTGVSYTGTGWTSSVAKTNYIDTDRPDGRPWREDFTVPMRVSEARAIAFDMHKNDKDKGGEPYHLHLSAVEAGVKVLAGPDASEERIAALFHDAVEDYHTTYKHLLDIGCTHKTLVMIEAVSKRSSEEQNVYLNRIINAGREGHIPKTLTDLGISHTDEGMEDAAAGAMRVKAADLMHNTRHDRIEALRQDTKTKHTADRLLKKYRPALARLLLELSLIITEEDQKIATKPQGSATGSYSYGGTTGSTTGGNTGKGMSVAVRSVLVGDWPTKYRAPIAHTDHGDGESTLTLANGEVVTESWTTTSAYVGAKPTDLKLFLYPYTEWSTKPACFPHWQVKDEDTILEFSALIAKVKQFNIGSAEEFDLDEWMSKNKKDGDNSYEKTGEDDLSGFWNEETGAWSGL